jgi:hypothetical protein
MMRKSFNLLKRKITEQPVLVLSDFQKDISGEMRCKRICNRGSLESRRQADNIFQ